MSESQYRFPLAVKANKDKANDECSTLTKIQVGNSFSDRQVVLLTKHPRALHKALLCGHVGYIG